MQDAENQPVEAPVQTEFTDEHQDKRVKIEEQTPAIEVVPLKNSSEIDYENLNEIRRQLRAHIDHVEKSGVPLHRQDISVQKTYFDLMAKSETEEKKIENHVNALTSTKGFTEENARTWIKALQANRMDPTAEENVYAFVAASARYSEQNARNAEQTKKQYENQLKRTRELEDQLQEYKKKEEVSRITNSQQTTRSNSYQQLLPPPSQQSTQSTSVDLLRLNDKEEKKVPINNPYFNSVAASYADPYSKKTNYTMKPDEAKLFESFEKLFQKARTLPQ
jgi:hypothetical protein